jgi:hypothetical protein
MIHNLQGEKNMPVFKKRVVQERLDDLRAFYDKVETLLQGEPPGSDAIARHNLDPAELVVVDCEKLQQAVEHFRVEVKLLSNLKRQALGK